MPIPRSTMSSPTMALLAATALVAFLPPEHASAKDEDYAKLAPFSATRFEDRAVHVCVDGAWYRLAALDDTSATEILDWCRQTYRGKWQKRFTEDLVEVLSRMGKPPGPTVSLDLVGSDGEELRKDGVPMTKDNRRAAWRARKAQSGSSQGGSSQKSRHVERVHRKHAKRADPDYADLLFVVEGEDDGPPLSAQHAAADLGQLEWAIENRYSYRDLNDVDVPAAFDAVRISTANGMTRSAFTIQLMKLLGRFGDGHTRVEASKRRVLARGYAPFLVGDTAGGVVAFHPSRSGFLDEDHPYLRAIDGEPLATWLEAAGRIEARGSAQFARGNALRNLRYLQHVRRELGLPEPDRVVLGLSDAAGGAKNDLTLRLADRPAAYGQWPRAEPRGVPGDIGYLRIASMDDEAELLRSIDEQMQRHANANTKGKAKTKGLVIDVRGNGGGTRDILRLVMPYLLPANSAPVVTNVARYRMRPGDVPDHADGYLSNRFLFPRDHAGWTDAERNAIDVFARKFRSDWDPSPPAFSAWHYMLVSPQTNPAAIPCSGKVIVLTNARCFSATDVFVGALATLPNVQIVGGPTGGGSGRSQSVRLAHSGLQVRLSSMASFTPQGQRYDGRGIAADVEVAPWGTDFLGTTDAVLEAAINSLR